MSKTRTHDAIDRFLEASQDDDFRNHLGASIVGRECARYVWYVFRWAAKTRFEGRMLRLFDRGHREELRFVTWLRNAGIEVQEYEPGTRRQIRVAAHDGHFAGSLDAKLRNVPDWDDADAWLLGEFKTHNDKSFQRLSKSGVAGAKWEHFVQMQIYMHYEQLPAALYMAINKNDDELYVELVEYNEEIALEYITRALKIIAANGPPPRISETPGWYLCKFCDMRGVCHAGDALLLNCRTCVHSRPVEDGQWKCLEYDYILSREEQQCGCTHHEPIRQ